jgi:hypothetical protein
MSVFAGPVTGQSPSLGNLLLSIDFANTKSYPGSGSIITDSIAGSQLTLNNPSFYSFDSATNSMNFTRDSTTINGGYASINSFATGTPLHVANYLYNNHSSEILARINTILSGYQEYPAIYSSSNNNAMLAGYTGYNTMFIYNSGNLNYTVWDGTNGPSSYVARATTGLTVGTSGTQIVQGQWFHMVVTRNGSTFKTYLNGNLIYTNSLVAVTPTPSNNIFEIGGAAIGTYSSFTKSNVALLRMYNIALSDDQVLQNFAAIRGRYSI